MTQDKIIRMARETGAIQVDGKIAFYGDDLERFAVLVAEPWIKTNKALAKEIIEMKKQAEQEPVAWWDGKETAFFEHELCGLKAPAEFHTPLYAAPVSIEAAAIRERSANARARGEK